MVAKAEKNGSGEAAAAENSQSRRSRRFSKPSWLLCSIADLDERMKMMTRKIPKEHSSDSFAARANSYYHERPQLIELLHDMYNGYLSLADRYCQALAKNHHRQSRCSSPIPPLKLETKISLLAEVDNGEVIDSDAESSLSFQHPIQTKQIDSELIVADLVMKTVECEIVLNELTMVQKCWSESSRKTELQKNLLDVLESERLILLNDNATLGYRVSAMAEENRGLVSESLFLKREAAELARFVLKTREDYRVSMVSRKMEDLQGQIYVLEKRNKEYYELLVKRDEEKGEFNGSKCFGLTGKGVGVKDGNGGGVWKVREKVNKFDLLLCGPYLSYAAWLTRRKKKKDDEEEKSRGKRIACYPVEPAKLVEFREWDILKIIPKIF